jgi:hypothetical protein
MILTTNPVEFDPFSEEFSMTPTSSAGVSATRHFLVGVR